MTNISQETQPTWLRQNNFNFLRILFASLVLLSHAPELIDGDRHREILTKLFGSISFGELAVDGFFLLSGYLIVKSWHTFPVAVTFFLKRVLRIYPAFIVASILGAFVVGPLGSSPSEYFSQFSIKTFLAGSFFLKPTFTPAVFEGRPYAYVNGAMWTISYEFCCYLLTLALGMLGAIKERRIWLAITCFTVALHILRIVGYVDLNGGFKVFVIGTLLQIQPFLRLASFFFVGGCFYLFREKIHFNHVSAVIAGSVLIIGLFILDFAEATVAIFGGYLLFYVAQIKSPWLLSFNKIPDVSYGLYLYGWPVQKLLLWYFPAMSPWVLFPISLAASAVLGLASWKIIEEPCLGWKNRKILGGRLPAPTAPT